MKNQWFSSRERSRRRVPLPAPLVFAAAIVLPPAAGISQVRGSGHDFSGASWNSTGEICVVCHTPHNSNTSVQGAPLWNHRVTTATFTLYSSPTMKVQPEQPRGVTKLCLSCHDGTVALDSFGGMTGNTFISGEAKIGTDLSNDHPVSIKWKHQNSLPSCNNCHDVHGKPYSSILPFFDGYVECATCHDPHNGTPANGHMLRMDNSGSKLCLYCHGK